MAAAVPDTASSCTARRTAASRDAGGSSLRRCCSLTDDTASTNWSRASSIRTLCGAFGNARATRRRRSSARIAKDSSGSWRRALKVAFWRASRSLVSTWCGYPWERVAMDLIPNLPVTKHGNRHLLVVVDYFTKWAEAFPLPDMRVEMIASVFLGEIVARYGAPCSVHTDQGRNLDGNLFRDVCSLLRVQKTRTTAYHPAGDGLVERLNQTIEKLLSHYVSNCHDDWDTHLPKVLMAYRSAVQSSTTYTPHYLMFG